MGREAECLCTWGDDTATVKALLESGTLILRGAMRRKVPFSQVEQVRVERGRLLFRHGREEVCLMLGEAAVKWQSVIAAPPVSLAKKLGITPESFVWSLCESEDVALADALSAAKGLRREAVDLIVASVRSMDDLAIALGKTAAQVAKGVPLWVVYPKGKGHAVNESAIRVAARAQGLIDTKVASVSPVSTGLRFVMQR